MLFDVGYHLAQYVEGAFWGYEYTNLFIFSLLLLLLWFACYVLCSLPFYPTILRYFRLCYLHFEIIFLVFWDRIFFNIK